MSRFRRVLNLPILGEALNENVRRPVGNITVGILGLQMVIPQVTWYDSWYAVYDFIRKPMSIHSKLPTVVMNS